MSLWIFHFPSHQVNQVTHALILESAAAGSEWPSNAEASPHARAAVYTLKTSGLMLLYVPWHRTFQVWSSRCGVLLSAWEWSSCHPATVSHQRGRPTPPKPKHELAHCFISPVNHLCSPVGPMLSYKIGRLYGALCALSFRLKADLWILIPCNHISCLKNVQK